MPYPKDANQEMRGEWISLTQDEVDALLYGRSATPPSRLQALWAELLQTRAGLKLAAAQLAQWGIAQPVNSEEQRIRHNEAVALLQDLAEADPLKAADALLMAAFPQLPGTQA